MTFDQLVADRLAYLDAAIARRRADRAAGVSRAMEAPEDRYHHKGPRKSPRKKRPEWDGQKPFTPEEDAFVLKHRKEGYSYSAIGEKIGRSKNAICGRVSRMRNRKSDQSTAQSLDTPAVTL